jgi:hypothetical protein
LVFAQSIRRLVSAGQILMFAIWFSENLIKELQFCHFINGRESKTVDNQAIR